MCVIIFKTKYFRKLSFITPSDLALSFCQISQNNVKLVLFSVNWCLNSIPMHPVYCTVILRSFPLCLGAQVAIDASIRHLPVDPKVLGSNPTVGSVLQFSF